MNTHSLAPIIRKHAFFAGLDETIIDLVTGCAENVRFESGTVMARMGDAADRFFLIREGRVSVAFPAQQGGSVTIQTLDEDDVVGWSWLIPPYEWQFDVIALRPVRALALDGKCLRQKCEQDPKLGYELMKRFSQAMVKRLQAKRLQLLDLYGNGRPDK